MTPSFLRILVVAALSLWAAINPVAITALSPQRSFRGGRLSENTIFRAHPEGVREQLERYCEGRFTDQAMEQVVQSCGVNLTVEDPGLFSFFMFPMRTTNPDAYDAISFFDWAQLRTGKNTDMGEELIDPRTGEPITDEIMYKFVQYGIMDRGILEAILRKRVSISDFRPLSASAKWSIQRVQHVLVPVLQDDENVYFVGTSSAQVAARYGRFEMPTPLQKRELVFESSVLKNCVWTEEELQSFGGRLCVLGLDEKVLIFYLNPILDCICGRWQCDAKQWEDMWLSAFGQKTILINKTLSNYEPPKKTLWSEEDAMKAVAKKSGLAIEFRSDDDYDYYDEYDDNDCDGFLCWTRLELDDNSFVDPRTGQVSPDEENLDEKIYDGRRDLLEATIRRGWDRMSSDFKPIPPTATWKLTPIPTLSDGETTILSGVTSAECTARTGKLTIPTPCRERDPNAGHDYYMNYDVWFECTCDGGTYVLGMDDKVLVFSVHGPGDYIYGRWQCDVDQWEQMWLSAFGTKTLTIFEVETKEEIPEDNVFSGRLFYDAENRRQVLTGSWNNDDHNVFPYKRLDLFRYLAANESIPEGPKDGVFGGSFGFDTFSIPKKDVTLCQSVVWPGAQVRLKMAFVKPDKADGKYAITSKCRNHRGEIIHLEGVATPSSSANEDVEYDIVFTETRRDAPPSTTDTASVESLEEEFFFNTTELEKCHFG